MASGKKGEIIFWIVLAVIILLLAYFTMSSSTTVYYDISQSELSSVKMEGPVDSHHKSLRATLYNTNDVEVGELMATYEDQFYKNNKEIKSLVYYTLKFKNGTEMAMTNLRTIKADAYSSTLPDSFVTYGTILSGGKYKFETKGNKRYITY